MDPHAREQRVYDGLEKPPDEPETKKAGPWVYAALIVLMAVAIAIFAVANHYWPSTKGSSSSQTVTQTPAPDSGATPVSPAPYYGSAPPFFVQPYIDQYTDEYESVLGTPGADWVLGDLIARADSSGYTLPVGDMTDWPSTVEVVAGVTPAERLRPDKSSHGYSTCDIQAGGSTTYVGQQDYLILFQYQAPTDGTGAQGASCTGGEYFLFTPEQVTKIASLSFT